jgi:hypothetical protein
MNSIAQRCCLVIIASIGSYEKKKKAASVRGTNQCAERTTDLQHRMELPQVLRIHGRTMGRLQTGVAWLGTLVFDELECGGCLGSPTT